MVVVIRNDLKMGKGKIAAQVRIVSIIVKQFATFWFVE